MFITLGGVSLSPDLLWPDKYSYLPVDQTVRTALDGRAVVYYAPNVTGRSITLQSTEETGWIDHQTVQALEALAAVAGQEYTLVIGDLSFQVMFRHNEPPAFKADPLIPRINPEPTDEYLVTIKLLTT